MARDRAARPTRRPRRRQGGGDGLTIIYWRDIPAQVTASGGGATAKAMLEPRFQHAIDRAAAVAELTETEAYIAQWRRATEPLEDGQEINAPPNGGLEDIVQSTAEALARRYPRERLEALVARGGADATDQGQTSDDPEPDEESDR